MTISEEKIVDYGDWVKQKKQLKKRVFRYMDFESRAGTRIRGFGKYHIVPDHEDFAAGNLTISDSKDGANHAVVIFNATEEIAEIALKEGVRGFVIRLKGGDKVEVYRYD